MAMAFSPYLIGVNIIVHGRVKGYFFLTLFFMMIGGLFFSQNEIYLVEGLVLILFGLSIGVGTVGLSESVLREKDPFKTLLALPLFIFVVMAVGFVFYEFTSEVSFVESLKKEYLTYQPNMLKMVEQLELTYSTDLIEEKALFSNPDLVIKKFLSLGPSVYFDLFVLMLWMNMFFLLRANRLVRTKNNSKYSEHSILNLQVPAATKWGLVISFAGLIISDYYQITLLKAVSSSVLSIIVAFYFFQGFGVYLKFLDFVKLKGFIRTFLVILTMFSARPLLAIVGFADEFLDFKKLMIKKNQGE